MSALPPKADMCSALGDVRFVPIADITTGLAVWFSTKPDFRLFQAGLAQSVEELSHRTRQVGNVLLTPRDGNIGHQFP